MECGNGWENLLDCLGHVLEQRLRRINDTLPEDEKDTLPCASQVKEKYGTLRFYMYWTDEEMSGAIKMAEVISGCICELCGNAGEKNIYRGWHVTRCCECLCKAEYEDKLKEYQGR